MAMYKCLKCGRHRERIKVLKSDPKTRKKWLILTCPACDYESDIEVYTRDFNPFDEGE